MPNREFPFNQPIHPEDNGSINRVFDRNYGNKLKSGDTTTLKYTIKDGDGEPLDKDRLIDMTTKVILKYDGIIAYETSFDAIIENETDNYAGDLVARFKVEEVLPPDEKKPYVIEFHFEELDQSDEVIDRFIFPSGNTLELFITPSSLNSDGDAIKNASEQRLNEIVERKLDENPVLSEVNELALKAQQAMSDFLAMLGVDVATLGADGKLSANQIPALAINDTHVVHSKEEIVALVAERGDVAVLVHDENVSDAYILTVDEPSVLDNWIKLGVSYVAEAGHAETATIAVDSQRINGHRVVALSEEEYNLGAKDPETVYLVGDL